MRSDLFEALPTIALVASEVSVVAMGVGGAALAPIIAFGSLKLIVLGIGAVAAVTTSVVFGRYVVARDRSGDIT